MPVTQNSVQQAVQQGYSPEEIQQFLATTPEYQSAIKQGYQPAEIYSHLGLNSGAPQQLSAGPPQQTGVMRYLALTGGAAVKGLDTTLGLPGTLIEKVLGPRPSIPVLPEAAAEGFGGSLPTIQQLMELTGQAGITDRADVIPGRGEYPEAEKLGTGAISGLASAAPLVALGAPPIATLLQGGLGGVAGQAAQDFAPGFPGLPEVAGAATGLGIGGLANALRSQSLEKLASGFGTSGTLQAGGEAVQQGAANWIKDLPNKIQDIQATVPPIAPTTLTPIDGYSKMVSGLLAEGGRYGGQGSPLSSRFVGNLDKQLNDIGTQATWEEAAGIQRRLGRLITNPSLDPSADQTDVLALYKSLLSDREKVAQANGIGDEFTSANQQISNLYDTRRGIMSKLVRSDDLTDPTNPKPGDVASRLMTGGGKQNTDLAALQQALPNETGELVAAHLRTDPGFWNKLSPEAKNTLVPDSTTQAAIANHASTAPSKLVTGIGHLQGLGLGAELGTVVGHFLGYPELFSGAMGGMAGYASPYINQALAKILGPSMLRSQAAGALGALPGLQPKPMGQ